MKVSKREQPYLLEGSLGWEECLSKISDLGKDCAQSGVQNRR